MNGILRRCAVAAALALAACVTPPSPPQQAATNASIPIEVLRPERAGRLPAVVMLHDCSGLGPRSSGRPREWAKVLLEEGYVVLIPDSFSTRGFPGGVCTDPSPGRAEVRPFKRASDAFETLRHARSLPFVDPDRVAVMGGSHGGASTLAALALPPAAGNGFVAGIALYPSCVLSNPPYRPHAPLLILTGELDDWTPAAPCRRLAETSRAAGYAVHIKVYPGAHHSFDSRAPLRYREERINANAPGGRGATTAGNAAAWADSIREVKAFLAKHLRGT